MMLQVWKAYLKVFLVTNQDNHDVRAGQGACISEPVGQRIVCFSAVMPQSERIATLLTSTSPPGDVIHKQCTGSTAIVAACHRSRRDTIRHLG